MGAGRICPPPNASAIPLARGTVICGRRALPTHRGPAQQGPPTYTGPYLTGVRRYEVGPLLMGYAWCTHPCMVYSYTHTWWWCMVYGYEDIEYRRGRSGRPIQRIRKYIRTHGAHVCCHCGEYIDVLLPDTHTMSWTIEHVIPLSIDASLALDETNMREAHRSCNSSQGNGTRETKNKPKQSRSW